MCGRVSHTSALNTHVALDAIQPNVFDSTTHIDSAFDCISILFIGAPLHSTVFNAIARYYCNPISFYVRRRHSVRHRDAQRRQQKKLQTNLLNETIDTQAKAYEKRRAERARGDGERTFVSHSPDRTEEINKVSCTLRNPQLSLLVS